METKAQLSLALSLFVTFGNAQENALPVSTVYATQGNVATRQSLDEADMQAAVRAARQDKALKAAMATHSRPRPVSTTAEQFLAANPPRVKVAPDGDADLSDFVVKRSDEVPEFEPVPSSAGSRAPLLSAGPVEAASSGKVGFFDWLKPKKPPTSPERNPFADLFTRGKDRPVPGAVENAELPSGSDLPNVPGASPAATDVGEVRVNAPTVPVEDRTDDSPSYDPPSSIFIPRQATRPAGKRATLKKESEANVGGVLVSIREGTAVGILSERGGVATIQMPDLRVGTIKSNALAR